MLRTLGRGIVRRGCLTGAVTFSSEKQPLRGAQQGGAGGRHPNLRFFLPSNLFPSLSQPSQKPQGRELTYSLHRSASRGSVKGTKWKWKNK